MGFPHSLVGKEPFCNAGDPGLMPGSERSPGEMIGCPRQYSWASLVAQLVKNLICLQCRRPRFNSWVGKIWWEGIGYPLQYSWASLVAQPAMQETLGRSPEEGKGYPFHYSGLENSMDCIVHGVANSRTQLRDFHFCFIS